MASLNAFDRSRLRAELRNLILTDDEARKSLLELATKNIKETLDNNVAEIDKKIQTQVETHHGSFWRNVKNYASASGLGISALSLTAFIVYIWTTFNISTIQGTIKDDITKEVRANIASLINTEINFRNQAFDDIYSKRADVSRTISEIEKDVLLTAEKLSVARADIERFTTEINRFRLESSIVSELTATLNAQILEADRALAKSDDAVRVLNSLTVDLKILKDDEDGVFSSRYERAIDMALSAFAANRINTDAILASLPSRYTYISPKSVGCERDYEESGEVNIFELPEVLKQFGDKGSIFFCKAFEDYNIYLSNMSSVMDPGLAAAAQDRFEQLAKECRDNARDMTVAAERAVRRTPAETYVLCERRPDRVAPDRIGSDAQ